MKKITLKRVGQAIAAAVVILGIYAGYLFLMTGQWSSMERYVGQFFEDDLKNEPTLTITEVSGGYLAWNRTVKLSNGQTVFFHRDNNPSAWQLEPGQKIAVYIAADDLAKKKALIFAALMRKDEKLVFIKPLI